MTGPREIVPLSPGCPWFGWAPPDLQHCEANLCGWITTPANTWSNLAYLAAAVWIWRRHGPDPVSRRFAWAAVALGATSFLFHASFTAVGQFIDYLGMFLYVLLLLALNLKRSGLERWGAFYLGSLAVCAAALPVFRAAGIGLQWIIVALVAGVLATEAALARRPGPPSYRAWTAGAGLMGAAALFWWLDFSRRLCDPGNHWFQGHAVWHLLSAAAVPCLAAFYRDATSANPASRY
jgi:hypothetical protein